MLMKLFWIIAPYEVHQTLQGKGYESDSWYEWSAMIKADTVPGALNFLKYASTKGIEIFYVTNRGERERDFTLKNLQKFNFPNGIVHICFHCKLLHQKKYAGKKLGLIIP